MDVANNVKVFGKLGYGATYAELTGVDNISTGSLPDKIGQSESKEGANYGVGVQYNINKFFVRAEYEMLPKVGSDQSAESVVGGTPVSEPEVYSISIGTSF